MDHGTGIVEREDDAFTIGVFGVTWRIRPVGLDAEQVAILQRIWRRATLSPTDLPRDAEPSPEFGIATSSEALDEVGIDPAHRAVVSDTDSMPYAVSRALTLHSITRRRGEALMLHAVGVSGPDGRTVAMVAPSGTGKTTAANVLGQRLGYVSDETVIIEADDRISSYAKPLSIIPEGAGAHAKLESGPDDLGLGPTPDHPVLTAIVVLRRDPDLAAPEFELVSLVDGILQVIPETSALPSLPDPLARLARALCLSGGPFKLCYPEISDCVDLIVNLTAPDAERDAGAPDWEHHPRSDYDLPEVRWSTVTWTSVVQRTPWNDAVTSDGEGVVLHGHTPSRLSRLGVALWQGADQPTTVPELHARIVEAIGGHPQSERLVLEGLQVLVGAKVLRIIDDPEQPTDAEQWPADDSDNKDGNGGTDGTEGTETTDSPEAP